MKISIVIPSYNQAHFLNSALHSVFSQTEVDKELIIIDGGSTDGSVDILRRYDKHINYWISEQDRGQTHAINKGLSVASGDIVCYLNSDDLYEPGSLRIVHEHFTCFPESEWLVGGCRVFCESTQETWELHPEGWNNIIDTVLPWNRPQRYVFPQSGASFMRRGLMERLGFYDEQLHFSMDMEYYARAAFSGAIMHTIPDILAAWRLHPNAKTWIKGVSYAFRKDELEILKRYLPKLPPTDTPLAQRELATQSIDVQIREALYHAKAGNRRIAFNHMLRSVISSPGCLLTRRWLGVFRRIITTPK